MLLLSCIFSAIFTGLFCLSVPSIFGSGPYGVIGGGKWWLLFVCFVLGFPNGAAAPIFYEFAAQITFPVSEGSSASALSLFENFGALFLYEGIARMSSNQVVCTAVEGGGGGREPGPSRPFANWANLCCPRHTHGMRTVP